MVRSAAGRLVLVIGIIGLLGFSAWRACWAAAPEAAPPNAPGTTDEFFFDERLNEGFPAVKNPPSLRTPRAALKHFLSSAGQGEFDRAGLTLNLAPVPPKDRARLAPYLAEHLYYVLNKKPWINWRTITDRDDGQLDAESNPNNPAAGKPRRSIAIATIPLDNWDVEIRLERFKPARGEPVWLFSPGTVEKIDDLYKEHGPGPLIYSLPPQARARLVSGDVDWQTGLLLLLVLNGAAAGWLVRRLILWGRGRCRSHILCGLADRIAAPIALLSGALVFYYLNFVRLSLSGPIFAAVGPLLSIVVIASTTWLGTRSIGFLADTYTQPYLDKIGQEVSATAKRRLTLVSVARRLMIFLAVLGSIVLAVEEVHLFDNWSTSVLASAGIVSVILGVAAHNVLGNVMAGIQIAITQPARIGDSVVFEGHWGYIEDITYTSVTIRRWDAKRVIVPVSYFISHPFENWSMKESHILTTVVLYVDYGIDIDVLRTKVGDVLTSLPAWDRQVGPSLQVTDLKEQCMELRVLCSAKDGPSAWDLQCHLREELIEFVRTLEQGRYLPKQRLSIDRPPEPRRAASGQGVDAVPHPSSSS
ncbi:MAG TPA: mechanosensitive ion channel domain-containing protein [Nitrospiraceae bacterium]|nr:mechanosensitive ion channel domain-containing protein [Nitrospiraceae bacterium]